MFAGAASYYQDGDSGYLLTAIEGGPKEPPSVHPYFKGVDVNDPVAFPGRSLEVMADFPPCLLIATTRDIALSDVVYTHSQLVKLGIPAELHVWEGLGHEFYANPFIPESADVYKVIAQFFERELGT